MTSRIGPVPVVASFVVGGMTALQARVNGELAVALGNGLEAAVYSFGSGLLLLAMVVAVAPSIRAGVARVPRAIRAGDLRWWQAMGGVLGGVFGLTFIVTASWALPRYGVLVFALATIAGQLSAALVLDLFAPVGGAGVQIALVAGVALTFLAVLVGVGRRT